MNQESLENNVQKNINNNTAQQVSQPVYTQSTQVSQPVYTQSTQVSQPVYTQPTQVSQPVYTQSTQASQPVYTQPTTLEDKESIEKITNLNKEDAMEEALSHTNQYTPFEVQQEEVNQETNFMSNKKALVFLGVILGIMLLFIVFLPQISKLIGW